MNQREHERARAKYLRERRERRKLRQVVKEQAKTYSRMDVPYKKTSIKGLLNRKTKAKHKKEFNQ